MLTGVGPEEAVVEALRTDDWVAVAIPWVVDETRQLFRARPRFWSRAAAVRTSTRSWPIRRPTKGRITNSSRVRFSVARWSSYKFRWRSDGDGNAAERVATSLDEQEQGPLTCGGARTCWSETRGHYLDTVEVTGSTPVSRTSSLSRLEPLSVIFTGGGFVVSGCVVTVV